MALISASLVHMTVARMQAARAELRLACERLALPSASTTAARPLSRRMGESAKTKGVRVGSRSAVGAGLHDDAAGHCGSSSSGGLRCGRDGGLLDTRGSSATSCLRFSDAHGAPRGSTARDEPGRHGPRRASLAASRLARRSTLARATHPRPSSPTWPRRRHDVPEVGDSHVLHGGHRVDHDEYDGRPPVAVHRGWHRKSRRTDARRRRTCTTCRRARFDEQRLTPGRQARAPRDQPRSPRCRYICTTYRRAGLTSNDSRPADRRARRAINRARRACRHTCTTCKRAGGTGGAVARAASPVAPRASAVARAAGAVAPRARPLARAAGAPTSLFFARPPASGILDLEGARKAVTERASRIPRRWPRPIASTLARSPSTTWDPGRRSDCEVRAATSPRRAMRRT